MPRERRDETAEMSKGAKADAAKLRLAMKKYETLEEKVAEAKAAAKY